MSGYINISMTEQIGGLFNRGEVSLVNCRQKFHQAHLFKSIRGVFEQDQILELFIVGHNRCEGHSFDFGAGVMPDPERVTASTVEDLSCFYVQ